MTTAAERAGELAVRAREGAGPLRDRVHEGALELADRTGPLIDRVTDGAGELVQRAGPLRERVAVGAGELGVAAAPVVSAAVGTMSGVYDESLVRGSAALGALRGQRVGPPLAVRRWPWAVSALLAGAAAGAAVALLMRKVSPPDAPDAQEPHELKAVVDQPVGTAPDPTAPDPTAPDGTAPPAA